MVDRLNEQLRRLSGKEQAAVHAWLAEVTGDEALFGSDALLDDRMQAWLSQFGLGEAMMWYLTIQNHFQGLENAALLPDPQPGHK